MTEQEFRKTLAEKGFDEPVLVERKPGARLDNHMHPFESMAFIISGDITIFYRAQRKHLSGWTGFSSSG